MLHKGPISATAQRGFLPLATAMLMRIGTQAWVTRWPFWQLQLSVVSGLRRLTLCLGNGGPYDMEGFQKCLHPLKVLATAYIWIPVRCRSA